MSRFVLDLSAKSGPLPKIVQRGGRRRRRGNGALVQSPDLLFGRNGHAGSRNSAVCGDGSEGWVAALLSCETEMPKLLSRLVACVVHRGT